MDPIRAKFFVSQQSVNRDQNGAVQHESLTLQPVEAGTGNLRINGHLQITSYGAVSGLDGGIVTIDITPGDLDAAP